MIGDVQTALQAFTTTGDGLTLTLPEPRFVTFRVTGNGAVTAGVVEIECCTQSTRTYMSMAAEQGAREAAELERVLPHSAQLQALCAFVARTFGWSTDQRPSVNYYGDVNTVVVCDQKRREELIAQRQRLLEEDSKGTVIKFNGDQADSQATGLPAPEARSDANVGAVDDIIAQNPTPVVQKDSVSQHWESIRTAETWRSEPEHHAGMFGPYSEELE